MGAAAGVVAVTVGTGVGSGDDEHPATDTVASAKIHTRGRRALWRPDA